MGQKSLDFSINHCIPTQFPSTDSKLLAFKANTTCSNILDGGQQDEDFINQHRRRYSTEELSRWVQRFTKAKITFRKQHDLRREVLVQNANLFAQSEIKFRQIERQKRWKEMKAIFALETSINSPLPKSNMASIRSKMADDACVMAVSSVVDVDMVRPITPVPPIGYKRSHCGCSPSSNVCLCKLEQLENQSLNKRPRSCIGEDCDDLKSLDHFLASLHCNFRQIG